MNHLECNEENCYTCSHKNNGIICCIPFCGRIVKRRKDLHDETKCNLEFKNTLPNLEICDRLNDSFIHICNVLILHIEILKNDVILKIMGDPI